MSFTFFPHTGLKIILILQAGYKSLDMWYGSQYHRQKLVRIKAFLSPLICNIAPASEETASPSLLTVLEPHHHKSTFLNWTMRANSIKIFWFFPRLHPLRVIRHNHKLRTWEVELVRIQTSRSTQKQCAKNDCFSTLFCSQSLLKSARYIFLKSSGFGTSSLRTHRPTL